MSIWQPHAKSGSAVLTLLQLRDWDRIELVLENKSNTTNWETLPAKIAKGRAKDFVYMGSLLVCNNEAWEMMQGRLGDDVENLPIAVGDTFFHILNVTRVVDCLDMQRSKFYRTPYDKGVGEIIHYEFQEEKVGSALLFTIPQKPKDVYASSAFKQMVEDMKLEDIVFEPPASPLVGLAKLMSPGPNNPMA